MAHERCSENTTQALMAFFTLYHCTQKAYNALVDKKKKLCLMLYESARYAAPLTTRIHPIHQRKFILHKIYALLALGSWAILLWPFPTEVFLATCFACLLHPLYIRLLHKFNTKIAFAYVTTGLCIGIVLPITIVVLMVTPQAVTGLRMLDDLQSSGWIYGEEMQAFFAHIDTWLRMLPGLEGGIEQLGNELTSFLASAIQTLVSKGLGIAGSTMSFMMRICVLISLSMIGIVYASHFFSFTKAVSRIPEVVIRRFVETVRQAIRSVLWGVVMVAIIQGVLCGLGFAVAGLPGPAFWGLVSAMVAPIPLIGTSVVWIPAGIYAWFAISKTASIGLILWCIIIVVGADNVLRPLFLRGGLKTSFVVVLIAVVCGLVSLGPVGIVAGPVLAAFALQAAREAELVHGTIEK